MKSYSNDAVTHDDIRSIATDISLNTAGGLSDVDTKQQRQIEAIRKGVYALAALTIVNFGLVVFLATKL